MSCSHYVYNFPSVYEIETWTTKAPREHDPSVSSILKTFTPLTSYKGNRGKFAEILKLWTSFYFLEKFWFNDPHLIYIHSFFYYYKNQENRPEAQCSYFWPNFSLKMFLICCTFVVSIKLSLMMTLLTTSNPAISTMLKLEVMILDV